MAGLFSSAKGVTLAAAVALGGAWSGAAKAENMADALVGAYNTSGLLEQNRALLRTADEDVAIAISSLRPIIDWTARISRTLDQAGVHGGISTPAHSSSLFTGLELSMLLYDGGASKLGVQVAKETVLSARQTLLDVEQEILLRAIRAYMNVLLTQENVSLQVNSVRLGGEELRAAQDRFDVGEVTRTDVALAESRLAASRSDLADARGFLVNAQSEYTNAVGHPPGTLVGQPALPQGPSSIEAAQAMARRNHPQILAAQHSVSASELAVLQSSKSLGPSASLFGDVGVVESITGSGFRHEASVGVILRQNIYSGGRLAAAYRRVMAGRDAQRAFLLTTERDVAQAVKNAFVRLEVSRASLTAANERVRAAQVAFDGIREEATLGARTTLDVLTAEQELLNAQTARISDLAERSIASYELLARQGLLTAERMNLGVQLYDPTIYYNLVKDAPANKSQQSKDLNRVLEALGKR